MLCPHISILQNEYRQLLIRTHTRTQHIVCLNDWTDIETMTATVKKEVCDVSDELEKKEWNFIEKNRISNLVGPFLFLFIIFPSSWEWYSFFLATEKKRERMSKRVEGIESKKKMKRHRSSVNQKLSNKRRNNSKKEREKIRRSFYVFYVIERYTPDRFVNEPDNMFQQQMPSIMPDSDGRFFWGFLLLWFLPM